MSATPERLAPQVGEAADSMIGRLREAADASPDKPALIMADGDGALRQARSYRELLQQVEAMAAGLHGVGIGDGSRVLLLVRPGLDFATVLFALDRLNAVPVIIDPRMGLGRMLKCIRQAAPEAMIAERVAHRLRVLLPRFFRSVTVAVVPGERPMAGALPLSAIARSADRPLPDVPLDARAPNLIVFTSGSTGTPKGVVMNRAQSLARVDSWNRTLGLSGDDVDLLAFPVFLPISLASGRSVVLPAMDFSRPGRVDPRHVIAAIRAHKPSICFGSPAFWRVLETHCGKNLVRLPELRSLVSGGAPIGKPMLGRLARIAPNAAVHTAYGATEALPLASISHHLWSSLPPDHQSETLGGTCVGPAAAGVDWCIAPIVDDVITHFDQRTQALPPYGIGEIAVRGGVVADGYFRRPGADVRSRMLPADGNGVWYRTGDAGYLDGQGHLWLCGRVAHMALDGDQAFLPLPVEQGFETVPGVAQCALVQIRHRGQRRLGMVIRPEPGARRRDLKRRLRAAAEANDIPVHRFFLRRRAFPVDRRHNAKVERLQLAAWAQRRVWL